jgi:hypothetical protein
MASKFANGSSADAPMKINEINPPARKPMAPCTPKLLVASSTAAARVFCRRRDADFSGLLPPGAGAEAAGDSAVESWLTVGILLRADKDFSNQYWV